jgi:signal transduction histidine kinase
MDRLIGGEVSDPSGRLGNKLAHSIKQTRRLGRLVDSLLDASRISAGRLQLQLEAFDLGELAREVTERLEGEASRAGCALSVELAPAAGTWDRLRLEQVLVNLLTNALKYAAGRPVHVQVRVAAGERVQLSVRDHGIGIAGEDVERIFGMFERAVPIRHYGGLGLGLSIVRQIVEAHGGRVEVESAPHEGSTFTVSLPLHASDARAALARPAANLP